MTQKQKKATLQKQAMDDIKTEKKNSIKETKVQNAFEALRKEDDHNKGEHIDDTHNTKESPDEWADAASKEEEETPRESSEEESTDEETENLYQAFGDKR